MFRTTLVLGSLTLLVGCDADYMTGAEAFEALVESNESSRGEQATSEAIEISTDATIGDAVEAYAQALAAFWESQVDCTTVTTSGTTVTVDYGTLEDDCTYNGNTYAGIVEVSVTDISLAQIDVEHTWTGFTNGDVQVDGGAFVLWDVDDETRTVATEHTWMDVDDGTTVDVVGEHVWGYIDSDQKILGGVTLDGTRDWTSDSGEWHVDMEGLELRLQDPAPQAGLIKLTNPGGKFLQIEYTRIDDDTIEAVLTGTREPIVFHINRLGIPTEV